MEVVAKLNRGTAFLDHSVYMHATYSISKREMP